LGVYVGLWGNKSPPNAGLICPRGRAKIVGREASANAHLLRAAGRPLSTEEEAVHARPACRIVRTTSRALANPPRSQPPFYAARSRRCHSLSTLGRPCRGRHRARSGTRGPCRPAFRSDFARPRTVETGQTQI
jgi:hypothetical protein